MTNEKADEPVFDLRELEPKQKTKRSFGEVSPSFTSTGLRRLYYKLDGAIHDTIVFESVLNGLPTNGSLLGWDERLIIDIDKKGKRPSVFKWVLDGPDLDRRLFPGTTRVCDLRLLGPNVKRGLIVCKQDLGRINLPFGTQVSRLMQIDQGENSTFEWVDINKRKGEEYK